MLRCIEKSDILKYFVILIISIALAMDLVNLLRPLEHLQAQIEIDYIATNENGSIQLFYRQDKQPFTEKNSIVSEISENGIAKFEIPGMNNELRIDIDGIDLFRIKSIRVIKNRHVQIINSDNWSKFYKTQHDVNSCFDDTTVISYEAFGIDPYIVFDIGMALEDKGMSYYTLALIYTVICFAIVSIIEKNVRKVSFCCPL